MMCLRSLLLCTEYRYTIILAITLLWIIYDNEMVFLFMAFLWVCLHRRTLTALKFQKGLSSKSVSLRPVGVCLSIVSDEWRGLPQRLRGKKNLSAMQELQETQVQALGWEDPLEEGMATPLQYSGLENPVGRGAWWATVHGVAKSWTRLRRLSTARTMSGEEGVWPCAGNGAMRERGLSSSLLPDILPRGVSGPELSRCGNKNEKMSPGERQKSGPNP